MKGLVFRTCQRCRMLFLGGRSLRNIKIGKITLSFTLISLGLVIFLEKFSHYKWEELFSVLWPAIIIFFGLEVIYASIYTKRENIKKPRLDKLSILIASLLLLTVGVGSSLTKELPHMKRAINNKLKYKHREDILEEVTLSNNEIKKLIIDDINSDIIISRSRDKDLKVRLEGIYKYNKKIKNSKLKMLDVENSGQIIRISKYIKEKRARIKKSNTENMRYLVSLPENTDIEIISKNGDVFLDLKANDNNDIDIRCAYGDVSIILPVRQEGKFNIITTYGSIYDELKFDIIESISAVTIDETRKSEKPTFNVRVNNGDVILKTD